MFFKKGQAFYADFLIGLLILIFITFVFTRTIIDLNSREDKLQGLINDGVSISNSIISGAYGSYGGWSSYPPKGRLGFIREGKIIKKDFDNFLNLINQGEEGYKKTKILLGAKNDYMLYFEYEGNKLSYGGRNVYGKHDKIEEIKADNIIKIKRIAYYNLDNSGKIVNMIILVF